MADSPRIAHVFDCAGTAPALVDAAQARGLPWTYLPARQGSGRLANARWRARLLAGLARADIAHVHFGSRAKWVRGRVQRPYVLHLHGSDIRTLHGLPEHHRSIQDDIDGAAAVVYSTPDLTDLTLAVAPEAVHLPQPVVADDFPVWAPAAKPRIAIISRWDDSKGVERQLATARELVARVGDEVDVVGIDWGPRAEEARAAGVQLSPKMSEPAYLRWLAAAHVAVGQFGRITAVSDLQAIGIGVPTVLSDLDPHYGDDDRPPVVAAEPDAVAQVAVDTLADPAGVSARLGGPEFVRRVHDPARLVGRLLPVYDRVLAAAAR